MTKNFQDHKALPGLNLTVKKGEIFALLGQNGAGKTTTINIFLGFVKPTSGRAIIGTKDVETNTDEARKLVGLYSEVVQLYANITSLEKLDFLAGLPALVILSNRNVICSHRLVCSRKLSTKDLQAFPKECVRKRVLL